MIRRGHAGTARKGYVSGTLEVPVQLSSHIVFFCRGWYMSFFVFCSHVFKVFVGDFCKLYPQLLVDVQAGHLPTIPKLTITSHLPFTIYRLPLTNHY
jgi:hypothetical protein